MPPVAPECFTLHVLNHLLGLMIEAHRRVERDVADGIAFFTKLTKDVCVLMTFERFAVGLFADENASAGFAVCAFCEGLVQPLRD